MLGMQADCRFGVAAPQQSKNTYITRQEMLRHALNDSQELYARPRRTILLKVPGSMGSLLVMQTSQ